ncbi:MAG: glucokinase [Saprospiraceae bacterium]
MQHPIVPIAFPERKTLIDETTLLAADVGGTKTHLALFLVKGRALEMLNEAIYPSKGHASLSDIIRLFLAEKAPPACLSIAFAGPVQDGRAQATNLHWLIDTRQLSQELSIPEVYLINDLESGAYGLGLLGPSDLLNIHMGNPERQGNCGIIAPGTGLGEAGLFWDGKALHPFAGEGGHTDFAPRSPLDWELQQYLQQQFGRVSWERVLSGPGMVNIFSFLRDVKKREIPDPLLAQMNSMDPAAAIGLGTQEYIPVCRETHRLFVKYLAIEASDLALKLNATGGIYICGGIPPKIWSDELTDVFEEHFFEVGRLRTLMEQVPVYLVLNAKTVMLGAAGYGSGGMNIMEQNNKTPTLKTL